MQDIVRINIDTARNPRWCAAEFAQDTLLRCIAQYRDYYVVMQRG